MQLLCLNLARGTATLPSPSGTVWHFVTRRVVVWFVLWHQQERCWCNRWERGSWESLPGHSPTQVAILTHTHTHQGLDYTHNQIESNTSSVKLPKRVADLSADFFSHLMTNPAGNPKTLLTWRHILENLLSRTMNSSSRRNHAL